MKSGYTHVSMLLDRSGSMDSIKSDTIGGVNQFINIQKKEPGEMTLTLCQFDNEYEIVYNMRPIGEIPNLTEQTYIPRGSTALLDSACQLIVDTGNRLATMPIDSRPERVMVVIITDGEENASHQHTRQNLADMVKHQEDVYKWQFVYIGANQDSFAEGAKMGMHGVNYEASSGGTAAMYSAVAKNVSVNRKAAPGEKKSLSQKDIDAELKAS
jgi:hypothetical protein